VSAFVAPQEREVGAQELRLVEDVADSGGAREREAEGSGAGEAQAVDGAQVGTELK